MGIRREVMDKLIERASGVFGVSADKLSELTKFADDLGAKSTQITQITTFLEDEFDTEIPFMDFRRKETFGEAVDYVVVECLEESRNVIPLVFSISSETSYNFRESIFSP